MTDYWVSKLFFDLRDPELRATYRASRSRVMNRYPLKPDVRKAVLADDVAALARLVNPYLLRYYFGYIQMPEEEFLRRVRASATPAAAPTHG